MYTFWFSNVHWMLNRPQVACNLLWYLLVPYFNTFCEQILLQTLNQHPRTQVQMLRQVWAYQKVKMTIIGIHCSYLSESTSHAFAPEHTSFHQVFSPDQQRSPFSYEPITSSPPHSPVAPLCEMWGALARAPLKLGHRTKMNRVPIIANVSVTYVPWLFGVFTSCLLYCLESTKDTAKP